MTITYDLRVLPVANTNLGNFNNILFVPFDKVPIDNYLQTRGWFMRDTQRIDRYRNIISNGNQELINVIAGDFNMMMKDIEVEIMGYDPSDYNSEYALEDLAMSDSKSLVSRLGLNMQYLLSSDFFTSNSSSSWERRMRTRNLINRGFSEHFFKDNNFDAMLTTLEIRHMNTLSKSYVNFSPRKIDI